MDVAGVGPTGRAAQKKQGAAGITSATPSVCYGPSTSATIQKR
jgi:hypothetical protein